MLDLTDTIAAIASPPGASLRGIVRISGDQIFAGIQSLSNCDFSAETTARENTVSLNLPELGKIPAKILVWPNGKSYTRQPSAEIHTIGSQPILQEIISRLSDGGIRLAEPGEFTLRAFLAGRLDLTEAEAVLGVIDATSNDQLQTALKQLSGGLAIPIAKLRNDLIDILANVEAELDFVEDDIQFVDESEIQTALQSASDKIETLKQQIGSRELLNSDPKVVIYGRTNVGKSSLFNCLLDREIAIVSDTFRTTRDFVSAKTSICGLAIELIDTAGYFNDQSRSADAVTDSIDQKSLDVMQQQIEQATVTLFCFDSSQKTDAWEQNQIGNSSDHQILVATRIDLAKATNGLPDDAWVTSSRTSAGIESLKEKIADKIYAQSNNQVVPTTLARCRTSVEQVLVAISRAQNSLPAGRELLAADLRDALDELGQIAGVVYTDDILDRVFSRFCIGK